MKGGDLAFYVTYFIPTVNQLKAMADDLKVDPKGSTVKAQKYYTLIHQIWELLPIFCRSNSPSLFSAFTTLIDCLDPMINKN